MIGAVFSKSVLAGNVQAVSSKSEAHRALICAALCHENTIVHVNNLCNDVLATIDCLCAMGAKISVRNNGSYIVVPVWENLALAPILDCGESGSTLRFLLPVCAALGVNARFIGHGALCSRPVGELLDCLAEHGVSFSARALPFAISGRLCSGTFNICGDVSSQFITGLMLAAPLLSQCQISLTTPLQSAPYVAITRGVMRKFGVFADGYSYTNQEYISPKEIAAQGDWSAAAFWLCAAAISGEITVSNLDLNSNQGDMQILRILQSFGAKITHTANSIKICHAPLHAISIDADEFPDLVPAIAAVACCAEGQTQIHGISRLRLKESDRVAAIISALSALGGNIFCRGDTIFIQQSKLHSGAPNVFADHRIAMMCAICACACDGEIAVNNTDCIAKSYPHFLEDFSKLGGNFHVVNDGQQN